MLQTSTTESMNNANKMDAIIDLITVAVNQKQMIYLFHHIRPDGDCLGSCFGLKKVIQDHFNYPHVFVVGSKIDTFNFLAFEFLAPADVKTDGLGIVIDVNQLTRVEGYDALAKLNTKICIDHHMAKCDFTTTINWTDHTFPAAAQMVIELVQKAQWTLLDDAATYLYLGLYTDTKRFLFSSCTPSTLMAAAFVWSKGAKWNFIHQQLNKQSSYILKIKQYIYEHYQTQDKVCWVYLDLKTQAKLNITNPLNANFPNVLENLDDNVIWIYFTQEKSDQIRCEFRSNACNVQQLAQKWGGGGHFYASGAQIKNEQTIADIIQDAIKLANS